VHGLSHNQRQVVQVLVEMKPCDGCARSSAGAPMLMSRRAMQHHREPQHRVPHLTHRGYRGNLRFSSEIAESAQRRDDPPRIHRRTPLESAPRPLFGLDIA
jgi:hypothetical protein